MSNSMSGLLEEVGWVDRMTEGVEELAERFWCVPCHSIVVRNLGFSLSFEDRKVDVGTHLAFNIYLAFKCIYMII